MLLLFNLKEFFWNILCNVLLWALCKCCCLFTWWSLWAIAIFRFLFVIWNFQIFYDNLKLSVFQKILKIYFLWGGILHFCLYFHIIISLNRYQNSKYSNRPLKENTHNWILLSQIGNIKSPIESTLPRGTLLRSSLFSCIARMEAYQVKLSCPFLVKLDVFGGH